MCKDDQDLSIDALGSDLVHVLAEVFPEKKSTPDLILVGHSMVSLFCETITSCMSTAKFALHRVARWW